MFSWGVGSRPFLVKNKFSFKTEEEKALDQLKEKLEDDLAAPLQQHVDGIAQIIGSSKADDLIEYQALIEDNIEAELAKRYFLQEGKTRQMLKNDTEVVKAIELLLDTTRYNNILHI